MIFLSHTRTRIYANVLVKLFIFVYFLKLFSTLQRSIIILHYVLRYLLLLYLSIPVCIFCLFWFCHHMMEVILDELQRNGVKIDMQTSSWI